MVATVRQGAASKSTPEIMWGLNLLLGVLETMKLVSWRYY
jgi:hypothetical protein